jgi:hypothetical protein
MPLAPVPRPRELTVAAPWLAAALLCWAGGLLLQRVGSTASTAPLPAGWQRSFRELPDVEQRTFRLLREALPELERVRVEAGTWPTPERMRADGVEPFRADEREPARTWSLRQHGVYATWLGLPPPGSTAQRWLVLIIEPTTAEPAPPEDEEHQTRADGVPVHVTVWSQANSEPPPGDDVLAFPAAEGWVQRVGR